jgi:hypothetical protein
VDLLLAASSPITAVVKEVLALISNQSVSRFCDAFMWSVADPLLFSLKKLINHLADGQDVDDLASVGPGP